MVKGISKQVIVVNSPDRKMYDQAIFILSDDAVKGEGITDEMLIREANKMINGTERLDPGLTIHSVLWMLSGALITAFVWAMTSIL